MTAAGLHCKGGQVARVEHSQTHSQALLLESAQSGNRGRGRVIRKHGPRLSVACTKQLHVQPCQCATWGTERRWHWFLVFAMQGKEMRPVEEEKESTGRYTQPVPWVPHSCSTPFFSSGLQSSKTGICGTGLDGFYSSSYYYWSLGDIHL